MTANDLYVLTERFAPIKYSEEFCSRYGAYDNSGLLINLKNEVKAAVFSLDLSEEAVEFAVQKGAGAIVTHHPAIYAKLSSLCLGEGEGGAVLAAARAGISVVSMHLNLDAAEGGIDECLACGVKRAALSAAEKKEDAAEAAEERMYVFSCGNGGYGRVYNVAECSAERLKEALDKELGARHTLLFANKGRKIKRVASFCGAGADEKEAAFAAENGADLIVSSDIKHHILKEILARGMAALCPTHYAAEAYGFYRFY
ncbi:MAG: Nif3-like dinuclear metal center hexameric protein, partial [Candidatus Scatosoma sp.]